MIPNVVYSIAIDPSNTNIIYAGVGRYGVFKSTDAGKVWKASNSGLDNKDVFILKVNPSNTSVIYAGLIFSGSRGDIFKSEDGGKSWFDISTGLNSSWVSSIAIDPSNNNVIYAGKDDHGIFKSTNGGGIWLAMNPGLTNYGIRTIAIVPSDPSVIYAATFGGIYKLEKNNIEITSVVFEPPKKLTITGMNFSDSPRVIINDVDRTDLILDASETMIRIKGKAKKLKLNPGDNTIQVITSHDVGSNVFILKI